MYQNCNKKVEECGSGYTVKTENFTLEIVLYSVQLGRWIRWYLSAGRSRNGGISAIGREIRYLLDGLELFAAMFWMAA